MKFSAPAPGPDKFLLLLSRRLPTTHRTHRRRPPCRRRLRPPCRSRRRPPPTSTPTCYPTTPCPRPRTPTPILKNIPTYIGTGKLREQLFQLNESGHFNSDPQHCFLGFFVT